MRRVLVLDEYTCAVLHEMRRWMVDEQERETLSGVARRLNKRGELTGKDRWRRQRKMPVLNEQWSSTGVKMILTSMACLGVKLNGRKPMHWSDGSPFVIARPVFDDVEWEALQTAIAARTLERTRKWGASPLLDIVYCGQCGGKATRNMVVKRQKVYAYYKCNRRVPGMCTGARMREADVTAILESEFLDQVGHEVVHRRVFVPGESHELELRELNGKIARLRQDRDDGLFDGADDEREFRTTMSAYISRRRELGRLPSSESGWRYVATGQTYREAREQAQEEGRRRLLLDAGVRFEVLSIREWTLSIPEDMKARLKKVGKREKVA